MENNYNKQDDKVYGLNRCYFDADMGLTTLALERIANLQNKFENDAQLIYAEGIIRKDFLGQGLKAQECFLKACSVDPNHIFSVFNSARYARNEKEYREQSKKARALNPNDPMIKTFDEIDENLKKGGSFFEYLRYAVEEFQSDTTLRGECASMAELALTDKNLNPDEELSLRKIRMKTLHELDKTAENSRLTRGEGFPPQERLSLKEALIEMEKALLLDPADHMLWNFKSGWLILICKYSEAIVAAEKSIKLCPNNYIKPRTNKALALIKLNRIEEAKLELENALKEAQKMGKEGSSDKKLTLSMLQEIKMPIPKEDKLLSHFNKRILRAAYLTSKKEMSQWSNSKQGYYLVKGLNHRTSLLGNVWSNKYINLMEDLLTDFCPETGWVSVLELSKRNQKAYQHCVHAGLFIASHSQSVMRRDACRFLIFLLIGAMKLKIVKQCYREAILGSTSVGPGKFGELEKNMRNEISKFNPDLLKLIANQAPLTNNELEYARKITMARFIDGISRDSEDQNYKNKSIIRNFIRKVFNY